MPSVHECVRDGTVGAAMQQWLTDRPRPYNSDRDRIFEDDQLDLDNDRLAETIDGRPWPAWRFRHDIRRKQLATLFLDVMKWSPRPIDVLQMAAFAQYLMAVICIQLQPLPEFSEAHNNPAFYRRTLLQFLEEVKKWATRKAHGQNDAAAALLQKIVTTEIYRYMHPLAQECFGFYHPLTRNPIARPESKTKTIPLENMFYKFVILLWNLIVWQNRDKNTDRTNKVSEFCTKVIATDYRPSRKKWQECYRAFYAPASELQRNVENVFLLIRINIKPFERRPVVTGCHTACLLDSVESSEIFTDQEQTEKFLKECSTAIAEFQQRATAFAAATHPRLGRDPVTNTPTPANALAAELVQKIAHFTLEDMMKYITQPWPDEVNVAERNNAPASI